MMKPRTFLLLILAYLLLPLAQVSILAADQPRVALVIGNGEYQTAPLRNPVNDARDISNALRQLGFDVIHLENADMRSMITAIDQFAEKVRSNQGVGLFYYSGHGLQVKGRNYLVPIKAAVSSETDVEFECVDAGRVLGKMEEAGGKVNIVILDACRNDPFVRSFRSAAKGLARMDAPKGTLLAYATSPGNVASDGTGRNSPYTAALIKYMQVGGLSIEQVFKRVRQEMDVSSKGKQIPWESTSLIGDFYFLPGKAVAAAGPAPAQPAATTVDSTPKPPATVTGPGVSPETPKENLTPAPPRLQSGFKSKTADPGVSPATPKEDLPPPPPPPQPGPTPPDSRLGPQARLPGPKLGRKVGTVDGVRKDRNLVVIKLEPDADIKVGDLLTVYDAEGNKLHMMVRGIKGQMAGAGTRAQLRFFTRGMEVYK